MAPYPTPCYWLSFHRSSIRGELYLEILVAECTIILICGTTSSSHHLGLSKKPFVVFLDFMGFRNSKSKTTITMYFTLYFCNSDLLILLRLTLFWTWPLHRPSQLAQTNKSMGGASSIHLDKASGSIPTLTPL